MTYHTNIKKRREDKAKLRDKYNRQSVR
eukprot:SAG31_NODE_6358_length_2045_cov_1.487667_1_plen_27_part_10